MKIGTIKGRDLILKAAIGHQPHVTGTGAHRDKKRCKKLRRQESRNRCRED